MQKSLTTPIASYSYSHLWYFMHMILSGRSPVLADKTMTVASSSSSLVCERLSVASSFILTAQLRNCVASNCFKGP